MFLLFKQKTAYDMRISDWRSDVCSSDLPLRANPAYASGSSMPWESPLNSILESIEGPVAKIIAVMVIIMTGLSLAFGETSGGFRRQIGSASCRERLCQ